LKEALPNIALIIIDRLKEEMLRAQIYLLYLWTSPPILYENGISLVTKLNWESVFSSSKEQVRLYNDSVSPVLGSE
jgi:hypothetical protein